MEEKNYIIDQPLPISRNFQLLKEEGLAFVQANSGTSWTNLNPADPGVTILDQLCYALTELGYCSNFPMRDLLTAQDGKIDYKNQFYLPSQILTSSPVIVADYQKVIIDAIPEIENCSVFFTYPTIGTVLRGINVFYQLATGANASNVETQLRFLLMANRNLGDGIGYVSEFEQTLITVSGSIILTSNASWQTVLAGIKLKVANAIFPTVTPISYQEALKVEAMDELYTGPLLNQGFIPNAALGEKLSMFTNLDLANWIMEVEGVEAVTDLAFLPMDFGVGSSDIVTPTLIKRTQKDALIAINWNSSLTDQLCFVQDNKTLELTHTDSVDVGTQKALTPLESGGADQELIEGSYRDVNSYYSIQNTFPASYGVGEQGKRDADLSFEVKQLKGYLTLFDQVLANEFSQLANVGTLFSFKNAISPAPSDLATFYAHKSRLEKVQTPYPVPYQTTLPTYFCQSLFEVPNVRTLLKDYQTFDFSNGIESATERQEKSWKNYRLDPYSPYMQGLIDLVSDSKADIERRNAVLNHLLARHGESAEQIDRYLNGGEYSGNKALDRVIIKSLYLQNLGLLSYYQPKSYNAFQANLLAEDPAVMVVDELTVKELSNTHDFLYNSSITNQAEHLKETDFVNYTAIELKMAMFFGFQWVYMDFIRQNFEGDETLLKQAWWMILQRKGCLFIESSLVYQSGDYCPEADLSDVSDVIILLPDYIEAFTIPAFNSRFTAFLEDNLPISIGAKYYTISQANLDKVIPDFAVWHNQMNFIQSNGDLTHAKDAAIQLVSTVKEVINV